MRALSEVADLAAEQWGLVTAAQAGARGLSAQAVARLSHQGLLERITHGVYRFVGAPPDPRDGLRAAWLTLDPSRGAAERLRDETPAVVSHHSAVDLHGLGDLDADEYEFTAPTRKQSRRSGVRLHRGRVAETEWSVVAGLPLTTVVRTVADLARARIDGGHLANVVRDALTVRQVPDDELMAALRPYAHHYGVPAGDGEALVVRFLQESGVPGALSRAVDMVGAPSGRLVAEQAHAFRRLVSTVHQPTQ